MNLDRLPDADDLDVGLVEGYEGALQWALGRYYAPWVRGFVPVSAFLFWLAIDVGSFGALLMAAAITLAWSVMLVRNERRWSDTEGSA